MLEHEDRLRILGFRVRHDINQQVFARGIISRNQLSNIESGKSSTTEKVLFQLYLRLCEYMVVLNDYQRFEFEHMSHQGQCGQFRRILDVYDLVTEKPLSLSTINAINLELNHNHFGLFNSFILEAAGHRLRVLGHSELADQYDMKAYYHMTTCNIDEVTIQYVTRFIHRAAEQAQASGRHLHVVELYDHLYYLSETVEGAKGNRDFLLNIVMAYRAQGFESQAFEMCKRILEISMNFGDITQPVLGEAYHHLAVLQHKMDMKDLSERSFQKAVDLLQASGSPEAYEALLQEGRTVGII